MDFCATVLLKACPGAWEAQASGSLCVVSDTVTKQVDVTSLICTIKKISRLLGIDVLECGSSWVRPNTSQ